MTLIACVDDKGGMLFNKRRQSRDARVCERILQVAENHRLVMNAYSAKLFENHPVIVTEDLLSDVAEGDYVFVENMDIAVMLHRYSSVILYRWNRIYHADMMFPMEQLQKAYTLVKSSDFPGNSHDVITEEVYSL